MIIYFVILDYYNVKKKLNEPNTLESNLYSILIVFLHLPKTNLPSVKKKKEKGNVVLNRKPAYELKNEA